MAAIVPNLEEAANVATEFIYSIDNLPNEVAHILQEIKHRDTRTTELQQEIDKEAYDEIHELAAEKVALAEKLIELMTRTRAKLDVDISKVRLLQGEPPELVAAQASASLNMKPAGLMALTGATTANVNMSSSASANVENFGAPGRNPALVISESLRNAMATQPQAEGRNGLPITSAVNNLSVSGHANKKRKTATSTSIKIASIPTPTKLRSASPSTIPAQGHAQQKSRLSRQVHPPPAEDEDDMDVDGEGDDDDAGVEDDERLYCSCRKRSFGAMIACDNEDACPYEWFHLGCVGLEQPPDEQWYCAECAEDKGLPPSAMARHTPSAMTRHTPSAMTRHTSSAMTKHTSSAMTSSRRVRRK